MNSNRLYLVAAIAGWGLGWEREVVCACMHVQVQTAAGTMCTMPAPRAVCHCGQALKAMSAVAQPTHASAPPGVLTHRVLDPARGPRTAPSLPPPSHLHKLTLAVTELNPVWLQTLNCLNCSGCHPWQPPRRLALSPCSPCMHEAMPLPQQPPRVVRGSRRHQEEMHARLWGPSRLAGREGQVHRISPGVPG